MSSFFFQQTFIFFIIKKEIAFKAINDRAGRQKASPAQIRRTQISAKIEGTEDKKIHLLQKMIASTRRPQLSFL